MTTANGTSHGGVGSAAAVTEELLQGSGSGSAPPPPPPPTPGNVDPRVIRDQIKAQQRQLRDARVQSTKAKIGRVNRQYWLYGGVIAALAVGVIGCRSYAQDQRDTALALAQITPPLGSSLMVQASCSEIGAPPPYASIRANAIAAEDSELARRIVTTSPRSSKE